MKRNSVIELDIVDMEFPSTGIGIYEDKKIYVKNAIRGQRVKARIIKKRKDYYEAKLVEVTTRSPVEVEAFCPHFGECGGCSRQTLSYEDQLKIKADMVKKLLDNNDIRNYDFLGIEPSPEISGYRNKMEYTFGDEKKDGEMTLGMHKKGQFNSIVTVNKCSLVDEDFNKILNKTLQYFKEKQIPHYNKRNHRGYLRHLVVRKGIKTGEILVGLVTTTQEIVDLSEYVNEIKNSDFKGKLRGIIHIQNDGLADIVQSDKTDILWGDDFFYEEIFGLKFKIYPFSFFQTNTLGAEKLYSTAIDFINNLNNKTVFDLYCGTGTIGQIIAKKAKKVIGIELVEEAVKAANENAKMNGLTNCTFVAGDVFEKIDELREAPDLIILDPPRVGVQPKALSKILKFNTPEIVYVSCNPKTLAENLKQIQDHGYKIKKVKCVDMFPHTPHVEVVSHMVRKE